jgi:hypothetical protein
MATAVDTTEEIILNDEETVVKLKPLSIKKLRAFMKVIDKMKDAKDEDEGMLVFIEACEICLSDQIPDGKDIDDLLDLPTITRILDVCGGIKLDDPNLVLAAAALNGQTST